MVCGMLYQLVQRALRTKLRRSVNVTLNEKSAASLTKSKGKSGSNKTSAALSARRVNHTVWGGKKWMHSACLHAHATYLHVVK